jgi:hypothetical protein
VWVREPYFRGSQFGEQGKGEGLNPVPALLRVDRCSVQGFLGWGCYLHRDSMGRH